MDLEEPSPLWIDNQAAIKQVESEESSIKSKHIDVKLKFIQDYVKKGILSASYLSTDAMVADLLTKELPAPRIQELNQLIGLKVTQ